MITNREKLAKMTNEELAEMLAYQDCRYCVFQHIDCYGENDYDCQCGILEWLNQESEE